MPDLIELHMPNDLIVLICALFPSVILTALDYTVPAIVMLLIGVILELFIAYVT